MDHKVKTDSFADKRRGSRHQRGYGTQWDKDRAQTLAEQGGLCQVCLRTGIVTPNCRTVDHIVPKAEGGGDERSNRQTICTPCHTEKTQQEAARARARLSDREAVALGLPHPIHHPAAHVGKSSGDSAHPRGAAVPGGQQAGGGEKSGTSTLGTDLQGFLSRAGVSGGGGI